MRLLGRRWGGQRHSVLLATALFVLAAYGSIRLLPISPKAHTALALALMGSAGLVAAGTLLRAALVSSGRIRLAWGLLALAETLWSATQLLGLRPLLGQPGLHTRTSLGDELLVVAIIAAVAGFSCLRHSRGRSRGTRLVVLLRFLDGVTVASNAALVMWMALVQPLLASRTVGTGAKTQLLMFVAFDIATVTLTALLASRPPHGQRVASSAIAAATLLFVASDVNQMSGLMASTYRVGGGGDLGWVAGTLLLAWGAHTWTQPPDGTAVSRWRPVLLPYALLPLTIATAAVRTAEGHNLNAVVVALGAVMVGAILARQLLTLADNMSLVTQMSGQEAELRRQASHDALTGLANRRLFRERLEEAVLSADHDDDVVVVFVDLDDFKVVNDTMGHAVGDELLRKMANRLQACIRTTDVAARLGGDEFAVLLTRGGQLAGENVATRLSRAMRQPIVIGREPLFIQASVGIAVASAELRSAPGELLEQADMAMYAAKDAGKARLAVFEPGMRERLVGRAAVKDDLHRALSRGQLHLHYQPIVDLRTGAITGAEALLRWEHPHHGSIPPLTFIPMAEETGLINRIGRWALQVACREAAGWRSLTGTELTIAVNFSGAQLQNPDVVEEVRGILDETGLPARLLTIEMTESVLMKDNDEVAAQLAALKSLGLRVAIDDFGTGYSGLSYLDRLPVDILKVDKAFVDKLSTTDTRPPLARAVVGLADMLRLDVVAEGIETPEQRELLVAMGCPSGQGYYFSRPVPAEALRDLLAQGTLGTPMGPQGPVITHQRDAANTSVRPHAV